MKDILLCLYIFSWKDWNMKSRSKNWLMIDMKWIRYLQIWYELKIYMRHLHHQSSMLILYSLYYRINKISGSSISCALIISDMIIAHQVIKKSMYQIDCIIFWWISWIIWQWEWIYWFMMISSRTFRLDLSWYLKYLHLNLAHKFSIMKFKFMIEYHSCRAFCTTID